jgi:predicted HAD superfamily hydrolase
MGSFARKDYLFCFLFHSFLVLININTKYLYIYPLKKKDSDKVVEALMDFIYDVEGEISYITADGE